MGKQRTWPTGLWVQNPTLSPLRLSSSHEDVPKPSEFHRAQATSPPGPSHTPHLVPDLQRVFQRRGLDRIGAVRGRRERPNPDPLCRRHGRAHPRLHRLPWRARPRRARWLLPPTCGQTGGLPAQPAAQFCARPPPLRPDGPSGRPLDRRVSGRDGSVLFQAPIALPRPHGQQHHHARAPGQRPAIGDPRRRQPWSARMHPMPRGCG